MSREAKLRAVLRAGERFVCLPKQGLPLILTNSPSSEELVAAGGTCANSPEQVGFLFATGALAPSPSAACKQALNRDGATNEWNGPRHVFIERDGVWTSYKQLCTATA